MSHIFPPIPLGWLKIFALMHSAAINMTVQVSLLCAYLSAIQQEEHSWMRQLFYFQFWRTLHSGCHNVCMSYTLASNL